MRIAIDARPVPYKQKEGMAFYAKHLAENLLKIDAKNNYVFFYNLFLQGEKRLILDIANFKNAQNKVFWIPGRILDFLWVRIKFPPIEIFLGKIDLFHTLAITSSPPYFYAPPQIKGKKIITIHDIFPLLFPKQAKNIYNIAQYKKGLKNAVKDADAIICVSKSTQKHLIKAFYIFRKNYDFKLVLIGNRGNIANEVFRTIDRLGLASDIIYLGYVRQEDLVVLLSAAELFVFPSFYEGFGFPNLEAMKCEVPVVSSNIEPINEIVGDAALLVDPYNPEELAAAMTGVISDRGLRNDLVAKGKERVKLFYWGKTAADTLAVYKKVAGG